MLVRVANKSILLSAVLQFMTAALSRIVVQVCDRYSTQLSLGIVLICSMRICPKKIIDRREGNALFDGLNYPNPRRAEAIR